MVSSGSELSPWLGLHEIPLITWTKSPDLGSLLSSLYSGLYLLWQLFNYFMEFFLELHLNELTPKQLPPSCPPHHPDTHKCLLPSLDLSLLLFLRRKRRLLFLSQKEYGQNHVTLSFLGPGEFPMWSWLLMFQTWSHSEPWMAANLLNLSQTLQSRALSRHVITLLHI